MYRFVAQLRGLSAAETLPPDSLHAVLNSCDASPLGHLVITHFSSVTLKDVPLRVAGLVRFTSGYLRSLWEMGTTHSESGL